MKSRGAKRSFSKTNKYVGSLGKDDAKSIVNQKENLKKAGQILMDFNLMIAAIALHYDLILVPNNQKHFQCIKGLKLENWAELS